MQASHTRLEGAYRPERIYEPALMPVVGEAMVAARQGLAEARLAEVLRLLNAGDVHAARGAASEACHADPGLAAPHYAYGLTWKALGQHEAASRAFAEAVRLAPSWVDAWLELGTARYRAGAIDDAKIAMRQILRRSPTHPAALANLAAFMRLTGEGEAADVLLHREVARAPGNHAARLNLAANLLGEEEAAAALDLLDAATELPTEHRVLLHWQLQRSLALLQLNRLDEASRVLDGLTAVPVDLLPMVHWRRVLLAVARDDRTGADRHAKAMAAALDTMGPNGVPEHRIMGHYDLAKFRSRRDEAAAAFGHWQAGHALLRPMQPFSRDTHRAFVDAQVTHYRATPSRAAEACDPAPVFIVGMPRSGTTLCHQIIAAHPQAFGAGERTALADAFAALGGGGETQAAVARVAAAHAATLDAAARSYLRDLHALSPGKARIVDKMPGNYRHLGLAAAMLPGAKFIHCVRDPRDLGFSIFTFRFHGSHGYAHDLGDLGWMIGQQLRLMEHWKAVMPGRILTVALSNWIDDFQGTLQGVLDHIGLPHDPACERFHETGGRVRTVSRAQVRQPISANGLGRYRAYAAHLAPMIAELDSAGALTGWSDTAATAPG